MSRYRHRYNRYDRYSMFFQSKSKGERMADAAREQQALEKKGQKLSPVVLKGFAIASTFWGKAWCKNIESYHDYSNRLPRGRSYVRSNSVIDLHIERGVVLAQVIGSALYIVEIEIRPVAAERWQAICKECTGKIGSMIELLQGRLSTEVMSVMTSQETGLFPRPAEIRFTCSCPDSAGMCKHIAAVMYGIGNRLDTQPELLFLLRGVDSADLLANIAAAPDTGTFPDAEALVAEELSDVFGVEIDTSVPTVPPADAPEPAAAPKRPRGRPQKDASAAPAAPEPAAATAAAPKAEAVPKRPRGRPRKSTVAAVSEPAAAPKRPRGRPRKDAVTAAAPEPEAAPKRPRGRPRKSTAAAAPEPAAAPKRPRGRPRKDTSATAPQPAAPKRSRKSTTAAAQESETAPTRPRGRPRKDASTAAAPEPAAAPKRPRGRPRKDAPAAT